MRTDNLATGNLLKVAVAGHGQKPIYIIHDTSPALPAHAPPTHVRLQVLSLGFLMTAFLRWCGMSEAELSLYRGLGALAGLAATALFPPLRARIGRCAGYACTTEWVCI